MNKQVIINLLPEIGCEVVAKEARVGRGRLHNVWTMKKPELSLPQLN